MNNGTTCTKMHLYAHLYVTQVYNHTYVDHYVSILLYFLIGIIGTRTHARTYGEQLYIYLREQGKLYYQLIT